MSYPGRQRGQALRRVNMEQIKIMATIGLVGFAAFWVSLYLLASRLEPHDIIYLLLFFVSMVFFAWPSGYVAGWSAARRT